MAAPWQRIVTQAVGLGEHLGPILLQFPANWHKNLDRLTEFLELAYGGEEKFDLAFEFREASWFENDVIKILEKFGAALCVADSSEFPRKDAVTANFAYFRYHGRGTIYAAKYDRKQLQAEARKIQAHLKNNIDVFAYFNNDGNAHAIHDAKMLTELIAS